MFEFFIGAAIGASVILLLFLAAGYRAARRKARTASSVAHVNETVLAVLQSEQGGRKHVIN
jgi:multisubunit Na+/H+ antiporter MnhB subunit